MYNKTQYIFRNKKPPFNLFLLAERSNVKPIPTNGRKFTTSGVLCGFSAQKSTPGVATPGAFCFMLGLLPSLDFALKPSAEFIDAFSGFGGDRDDVD